MRGCNDRDKWINGCWSWQESDRPLTKDEFIQKFFPQSLRERAVPIGGIITNKFGRPVDWNSKSAKKGRATRFTNRINAAYTEYREIHPNKTAPE